MSGEEIFSIKNFEHFVNEIDMSINQVIKYQGHSSAVLLYGNSLGYVYVDESDIEL